MKQIIFVIFFIATNISYASFLNLDFSGLDSLSKMGKKLGEIPKIFAPVTEDNATVTIHPNVDMQDLEKSNLCLNTDMHSLLTNKENNKKSKSYEKLILPSQSSLFAKKISLQKFTRDEAIKYCKKLSIGKYSWYLPSQKELLELSTDKGIKNKQGKLLYIKREYLDLLPSVKNIEDLRFWTSTLWKDNTYEVGYIVGFSHSLSDQLGIGITDKYDSYPDMQSDKKSKYNVICKRKK